MKYIFRSWKDIYGIENAKNMVKLITGLNLPDEFFDTSISIKVYIDYVIPYTDEKNRYFWRTKNLNIDKFGPYIVEHYMKGAKIPGERTSILGLGEPGIGKSKSVEDAAREISKRLGKKFIDYSDDVFDEIMEKPDDYFVYIDLRLTECEPSDLCGIPQLTKVGTKFTPLLWARCLNITRGMLVLDETNK